MSFPPLHPLSPFATSPDTNVKHNSQVMRWYDVEFLSRWALRCVGTRWPNNTNNNNKTCTLVKIYTTKHNHSFKSKKSSN